LVPGMISVPDISYCTKVLAFHSGCFSSKMI
jgi:hypothetical protein